METDMFGLILLAIAAALIFSVTIDLIRTQRGDQLGARIVAEEKERRRRAQRKPR